MENRIVCLECDTHEFYALIPDENTFIELKCIECGAIIRADSDDNPSKNFIIDRCVIEQNN